MIPLSSYSTGRNKISQCINELTQKFTLLTFAGLNFIAFLIFKLPNSKGNAAYYSFVMEHSGGVER